MERLELGEIVLDVVIKDIKNVHLSVYPPAGKVRISAPLHMSFDTIRAFAISKLGWIREQQKKLRAQERETPREYLDRESHYLWGKRYLLKIVASDSAPTVTLTHGTMVLHSRAGSNTRTKDAVLKAWYREQLKAAIPSLIERWEPLIGVEVKRFYVQQMKTKWGSCNAAVGTIRLNTELAKKPRECLEYIVVHEMVHLLERTHNANFVALMDQFIPKWTFYRDALNRLPVRHETWGY